MVTVGEGERVGAPPPIPQDMQERDPSSVQVGRGCGLPGSPGGRLQDPSPLLEMLFLPLSIQLGSGDVSPRVTSYGRAERSPPQGVGRVCLRGLYPAGPATQGEQRTSALCR